MIHYFAEKNLTQRREGAKTEEKGESMELKLPAPGKSHENPISKEIVDAAYTIHTKLGPGLLESVYEVILTHELEKRGLRVQRQLPVPIIWDDIQFEEGYRLDLMVEEKVVVEVKSVESVERIHKKQLLTYLRLMDKRLGLLINFNAELIRDGISRVVNGLEE